MKDTVPRRDGVDIGASCATDIVEEARCKLGGPSMPALLDEAAEPRAAVTSACNARRQFSGRTMRCSIIHMMGALRRRRESHCGGMAASGSPRRACRGAKGMGPGVTRSNSAICCATRNEAKRSETKQPHDKEKEKMGQSSHQECRFGCAQQQQQGAA